MRARALTADKPSGKAAKSKGKKKARSSAGHTAKDDTKNRASRTKKAGVHSATKSRADAMRNVVSPSVASQTDALRATTAERIAEGVRRMLEEATDDTVRNVLREPTDISSIVRLVSDVGIAAAATIDPLAGAYLRGIETKRRLLEESGGAYTTGEVAALLGISEQAVHARLTRNRLLAVSTGNDRHRFPTCQFTSKGVVPGIAEFLDACSVDDPWSRLALLLDPQPALGEQSILDALRTGDRETALRLARSFGA